MVRGDGHEVSHCRLGASVIIRPTLSAHRRSGWRGSPPGGIHIHHALRCGLLLLGGYSLALFVSTVNAAPPQVMLTLSRDEHYFHGTPAAPASESTAISSRLTVAPVNSSMVLRSVTRCAEMVLAPSAS